MATTTTNFNFPIPQSTDLVKDGATAIAALGTSIDTDFVDLKGGTTGQVLAKASNTDLDYSWTTPQVGDITAVTAGTGITGGGTSGAVTVSFDIANYGGGQFSAGKNKIINSDFGIWQRGTTFSNPSPLAYTADRWQLEHDGSGATRTISQQTFTPGTAPVSGYEGQYFYRYAVTGGTSNTYQQFQQKLEDVRTFAGQTVTLSFWAKADASRTLTLLYRTDYGSGGSSANQFSVGTASVTSSWARYSVTYAVPSVSGLTIGANSFGQWIFRLAAATAQTIDIWGVQIESGSTATPFQTASGSLQGELALCQRYYFRINASQAYSNMANSGYTGSTTAFNGFVQHPVTMRSAPTSIDWSGLHALDVASATITLSNPSFAAANTNNSNLAYTAVGATASRFAWLRDSGGSTGYLGLSAEL